MRVGTSKEFQFVTRVQDPEDRNMDMLYVLLLVGPLVLAACSLGLFGYKRITAKNNRQELVAPHPFPAKKAWAQSEQDRLRLMHSVKQVKAQRELALGTLDGMEEDDRIVAVDLPDFSGTMQAERASLFNIPGLEALEAPQDDQLALARAGFDNADQLQPVLSTAASGIMSKVGGKAKRANTQDTSLSVVDVRRIQNSTDDLGQRAGRGSRTRRAATRDIENLLEEDHTLGPISPVSGAFRNWDVERDGPIPPDLSFPHSMNMQRRNMLLKILDM